MALEGRVGFPREVREGWSFPERGKNTAQSSTKQRCPSPGWWEPRVCVRMLRGRRGHIVEGMNWGVFGKLRNKALK